MSRRKTNSRSILPSADEVHKAPAINGGSQFRSIGTIFNRHAAPVNPPRNVLSKLDQLEDMLREAKTRRTGRTSKFVSAGSPTVRSVSSSIELGKFFPAPLPAHPFQLERGTHFYLAPKVAALLLLHDVLSHTMVFDKSQTDTVTCTWHGSVYNRHHAVDVGVRVYQTSHQHLVANVVRFGDDAVNFLLFFKQLQQKLGDFTQTSTMRVLGSASPRSPPVICTHDVTAEQIAGVCTMLKSPCGDVQEQTMMMLGDMLCNQRNRKIASSCRELIERFIDLLHPFSRVLSRVTATLISEMSASRESAEDFIPHGSALLPCLADLTCSTTAELRTRRMSAAALANLKRCAYSSDVALMKELLTTDKVGMLATLMRVDGCDDQLKRSLESITAGLV